ncbi:Uncharacterised protein [uncultured archaeon]|nr:Uncharacterised protein [uncultured archaeon]
MNENLSEALKAIQTQTDELQRQKTELARGPKGDRGEPGIGKDGRDGISPKLTIGQVSSGDNPHAEIRNLGEGIFELNLVLPRGERGEKGEASTIQGPAGRDSSVPGPAGRDGVSVKGPKGDAGSMPEVRVGQVSIGDAAVKAKPFERGVILDFTLPKAKDGVDGKQGDPGRSGFSEDEIRTIVTETIIKTLSDVGVISEQAEKLIRVRTELKRKLHEVDARHISEISDFVKRVDRIFES